MPDGYWWAFAGSGERSDAGAGAGLGAGVVVERRLSGEMKIGIEVAGAQLSDEVVAQQLCPRYLLETHIWRTSLPQHLLLHRSPAACAAAMHAAIAIGLTRLAQAAVAAAWAMSHPALQNGFV